ncbi:MAG: hypothetical protein B7C24_09955 [Bacteroidetes bacterium 4572_77]|nr:MAG: hypothetical protein B7C24_09955 [Bacteroidetes bacterium 4572_77]
MKKPLKKLEFNKILETLREYDTESTYEKVNIIPDNQELYDEISALINTKSFTRRAVLGIDIYRYGMFKHLEQTLIPAVFKIFFEKTIRLCLESNAYVFQNYSKKTIENSFISTGDGGFLILETPLHAMFFAINFEVVVRSYNSFHLYPRLRKIIGSISLRYAITYDTLFQFDNNYYGSAIINNSRILDKDNLNRCLLDESTFNWFLLNTDGIENLQVYTIKDISNIYDFQNYNCEYINGVNEIIPKEKSRLSGIINSDILKIGQIQAKEMDLNIYNLHLQVSLNIHSDAANANHRLITISLGNLNTSGI